MHCQAVMHDYIWVKMPKMVTLVKNKESQEISNIFSAGFFAKSILKSSRQILLPPINDRVKKTNKPKIHS